MANRFTEGLKQLTNGLYRLREDVLVSDKTIVEKLKPSKITESVSGNELPIYGKYTIKVWDLDNLNKNGRNYSDVAEIAMKTITTDGLANHPEDDEWDVTKTFAVETNPRIINGWLCCDITLVGELGKLAESILRAGGQLRFSSSAQGDVDNNGRVLREGFLLERFADWVANPSNGVHNYLEDMQESKDKYKSRNKREEISNSENVTILREQENNSMDKLQESVERLLVQNINGMFKTVESESSILEKKNLLEQIIQESSNLSDKTLFEKATKKKAEVEKELEEKAKKADEVDSVKEEMKKKEEESGEKDKEIENLKEKLIISERKYKSLVEMYENKQYNASKKETSLAETLNSQLKLLRQSNRALKEKLEADKQAYDLSRRKLQEKAEYFEALSNTRVESEQVIKLNEEIKVLKSAIDVDQDKLREAHKIINEQKLRLSETRKQALRNRISESEKPKVNSLRNKFSPSRIRESVYTESRRPRPIRETSSYEDDSYGDNSLSGYMDTKSKEHLVEKVQDDYIGITVKESDLKPVNEIKSGAKVASSAMNLQESWDGYDEADEAAVLSATQKLDGNTVLARIKENG